MLGMYIVFLTPRMQPKQGIGVFNKIFSQIDFFQKQTGGCELITFPHSRKNSFLVIFEYFFYGLFRGYSIKKKSPLNIDYCYFRKPYLILPKMVKLFSEIKSDYPNCKIVMEIPTYPYDKEYYGFLGKVILRIDNWYCKKLCKYVDAVTTYSEDKEIFNKYTINIVNGIDCGKIKRLYKNTTDSNEINCIMVSQFSVWHGVDRIINGLYNYYKSKDITTIVKLHLVGEGKCLDDMKKFVTKNDLQKYVRFYGMKSGSELESIYQIADLGLCSLANHRHNIYVSSELKSREYLAKGLPIVTATKIDVIPDFWPYCLNVESNDMPLDILEIIKFYQSVYIKNRNQVIEVISQFAKNNCDITNTMLPVLNFIKK